MLMIKSKNGASFLGTLCTYSLLLLLEKTNSNSCNHSYFQVDAAQASPHRFRNSQPDGDLTPELEITGSPSRHTVTDAETGFTVIEEEETGTFVYAKKDEESGQLVSSGISVGGATLEELTNITEPMVEASDDIIKKNCGRYCMNEEDDFDNRLEVKLGSLTIIGADRALEMNCSSSTGEDGMEGEIDCVNLNNDEKQGFPTRRLSPFSEGTVRNLVVLIRFSDHTNRELPKLRDYNYLFNRIGGDPEVAPTGSIRDVFLTSSYQKVDLISTIVGWVRLPETEKYYADGTSGSTDKFEEALEHALNVLDNIQGFSFDRFDKDGDGFIDSLVFIHSGYGAEWGKVDCNGQKADDRIWSHQWKIDPVWTSTDGFKAQNYFTSSGLWDSCNSEIARIGTISHEIGHVFGLPDLYLGGSGIGSHGLMGNSWGFDGSQLYPPIMSPWCKIMLGWLEPVELVQSGRYTLDPVASTDQVFIIRKGYSRNEYLLIENKQPMGFDQPLPKGGLAIYHIDNFASFYKNPGYPGQDDWPGNGNHYRVALLQPDGMFHLEKGDNRGDATDLFGPGDELKPGPGGHPNSDGYQGGKIKETGIKIFDIVQNEFDQSVSFSIDFGDETNPDTPTTSSSQVLAPKEIMSDFAGDTGAYGIMFDIQAGPNSIIIFSLDLHIRENYENPDAPVAVKVFTKSGSFEDFQTDADAWEQICSTSIKPEGFYKRTKIDESDFEAITINTDKTQAFYVTLDTPDLRYSKGVGKGNIAAVNSDLKIFEGTGLSGEFSDSNFSPRIFNGFVKYYVVDTANNNVIITNEESHKLTTNFVGNNGNYGIMFDVHAKKTSVTVTGMDVHLKSTGNIPIEVWSKSGTHHGHERDSLAWEQICNTNVLSPGQGFPAYIPDEDFNPVQIYQGDVRAFYVTTKLRGDIRYNRTPRNQMTSDDYIEIKQGSGMSYPFAYGSSRIFSPREFSGTVKYSASSLAGVVTAENNNFKELLTSYSGTNGSYGVMFDIRAKRDLTLISFDIHTRSMGQIVVEAYTKRGTHEGYERRLDAWTLMCEGRIDSRGSYKRTSITENCFSPLELLQDELRGIYITLRSLDLRYSDENEKQTGDIFTQNDDIEIMVGKGIGGYPLDLSTTFFPKRLFNGVVKYEVQGDVLLSQDRQVETKLEGGNRSYGCIFLIEALQSLKVTSIDFHTRSTKSVSVEVWTRTGTYEGHVHTMDGWTKNSSASVDGLGIGLFTEIDPVDFETVQIEEGGIQAFFITLRSADLIYTNGNGNVRNEVINSNYDLIIEGGVGIGSDRLTGLTSTYYPRLFNGKIRYTLSE